MAGLLLPRQTGSYISSITLESTEYQVPSTLNGGVIQHATFATALATSMFTAAQGTPAGFGLTREGKFRTVCLDGAFYGSDGSTTNPAGFGASVNVYDIADGVTPVRLWSFFIVNAASSLAFNMPIRLKLNGGVAFNVPLAIAGAGIAMMNIAWHFEDNVGNS